MTDTRLPPEADLVLLNALVDGELDAVSAAALERRIAEEPTLRKSHETFAATHAVLGKLERPRADAKLLGRIEAAIGASDPASSRRPPHRLANWRALAASIVIIGVLAGSGGYWLGAQDKSEVITDLAASSHRRSLLAASPVDIASSDRHTVKPWLDARIGISPPAPDLAAQGFPLVGGRVDVIGGRTVTLVYRHNEHLITVVAEPAEAGASSPQNKQANGYNMVNWMGSGFSYWAVSDLERAELDGFVAAYRTATSVTAAPER